MTELPSPSLVPFEELGFFSRLYRQYCDGFERLAPFYQVDYRSIAGRREAADAAAAHDRDRARLVSVLTDQNARWGEDPNASKNIEALAGASTVAVVTGQQVGLFTGPLYTIYKTITVLQMARQLSEETGRTVVPVFWLEGDDHDFAEIASVSLLSAGGPVRLAYSGHELPIEGNLGPVGRLALTDRISEVTSELDAALPPTDFKSELMEAVLAAYRPGVSVLDAFATLMRRLFRNSGLVFITPDDPRLKEMVVPLFEREIRDTDVVSAGVDRVSEELRKDYHAQVSVRPSNLFLIDEQGRHPIDAVDGSFHVRGTGRSATRDELLNTLSQHPASFSANVVLRPLVQDTLLPTALYVAGPSEIAYFAQLKPVYEWAGIPMPAIFPRASATLVEGKVQKVLEEFELSVADFDEDLETLFQRILRERLDSAVDAQFSAAAKNIHEAVNSLRPLLQDVDRTLVKSAEAMRAQLLKEFERFRHRVLKAEKRKHELVRDKLEKAKMNLFPSGKPQERSVSVLYFMNKYGHDLIDRLQATLSLDTSRHQVIRL